MTNKCKSLADAIQSVQEDMACQIEHVKKQAEKTIQEINHNRQAIMNLDAIGYDCNLWSWSKGDYATVQLNEFKWSKAGKADLVRHLNAIRRCLGSKLSLRYKDVSSDASKPGIDVSLTVDDFPGIVIKYTQLLRKNDKSKCRIVTEKVIRRTLVCER